MTFILLLKFYGVGQAEFQTVSFVVSLVTQIAVVYCLRTREVFFRSRPSSTLMMVSAVVAGIAVSISYLGSVTQLLGFVPIPLPVMAAILIIVLAYVGATEIAKHWFYKTANKLSQ